MDSKTEEMALELLRKTGAERMSYQAIADQIGKSVGTVSTIARQNKLTRGRGGTGSLSVRGAPSEIVERAIVLVREKVPIADIAAQLQVTRQGVESALYSRMAQELRLACAAANVRVKFNRSTRVATTPFGQVAIKPTTMTYLFRNMTWTLDEVQDMVRRWS